MKRRIRLEFPERQKFFFLIGQLPAGRIELLFQLTNRRFVLPQPCFQNLCSGQTAPAD